LNGVDPKLKCNSAFYQKYVKETYNPFYQKYQENIISKHLYFDREKIERLRWKKRWGKRTLRTSEGYQAFVFCFELIVKAGGNSSPIQTEK